MANRTPHVQSILLTAVICLAYTTSAFQSVSFVPKQRWNRRDETRSALSSSSQSEECTPMVPDVSSIPLKKFRKGRRQWPKWLQYFLRDSGGFRWLVDFSTIVLAVPSLVRQNKRAIQQFWQLSVPSPISLSSSWQQRILSRITDGIGATTQIHDTNSTRKSLENVTLRRLSYGSDRRQVVHLLQRHDRHCKDDANYEKDASLAVFVHGGAWGSGFPALYRLAAVPFLEETDMDVAIVGYRTYPTASVPGQVEDVAQAIQETVQHLLRQRRQSGGNTNANTNNPTIRVCLVGHSSGAHLCALGLLQGLFVAASSVGTSHDDAVGTVDQFNGGNALYSVDRFVGIAGVYDIPDHYQFESRRGVERISPMAPAFGGSVAAWRRLSPTQIASAPLFGTRKEMPPILLCHGALDTTVPCSSSERFYEALSDTGIHHRQSRLEILTATEHAETIVQFMFGGKTRTIVMSWLSSLSR